MDPVSQGVVGAIASASLPKHFRHVRTATLVGWIGGTLADADILIRSKTDPLLTIQYHRHFSHSLAFIPFGGVLCATLLWLLLRGRIPFRRLLVYSTAGYATSGLLDACTSYGTHLLWPFSEERTAWSNIAIVDPVFTLTLLILTAAGFVQRRNTWMRSALAFALAYLFLGVFQHQRASAVQAELAAARGHSETMELATVKPSIGNLVLWRSLYLHEGRFHADAIRVGIGTRSRVYEGTSVSALELEALLDHLPSDSTLAGDLTRFDYFSAGYLARHPDQPDVVGDLRYAMLPDSSLPLWGIRYDPDEPDGHVRFESFREPEPGALKRFLAMLRGKPPPEAADRDDARKERLPQIPDPPAADGRSPE